MRLAHFSDTHLSASAFAALSPSGMNQREEDIAKSFFKAIRQIRDGKFPLTIHSGDLFHTPRVEVEHVLAAQQGFGQLVEPFADEQWNPQVIVVDGNHDEQRRLGRPSPLSLLKGISGLHVANTGYEQITFDVDALGCHPALADVVVHAIPHIELKHLPWDAVQPVDGKVNILVTHGVAEGSELYRLNLTREYAIPLELMTRGWDYVALGHYHRQGPVHPGQFGTGDKNKPSRIWYAGSTDTVTFSDFSGARCDQRGWLEVDVEQGEMPKVTPRHYPVRTYLRLPEVDVDGLTQDEIVEALKANITGAKVAGAVAVQKVTNITRDVWSTVDVRAVRDAASDALHYELKAVFKTLERPEGDDAVSTVGFGDLPEILEEVAAAMVSDDKLRGAVLKTAHDKLGDVLGDGSFDPDTGLPRDDAFEPGDGTTSETDDRAAGEVLDVDGDRREDAA